MAIIVSLVTSLVQSVHGIAFLVGGLAYVAYITLMNPSIPSSRCKDRKEARSRPDVTTTGRLPWGIWALVALVLALLFSVHNDSENGSCMGEEVDRGSANGVMSWGSQVSNEEGVESRPPSGLLEAAHAAADSGDDETSRNILGECVSWKGAPDVVMLELHAQLECHGELLEMGVPAAREAAILAANGRRIVRVAFAKREENPSVFTDIQVEWARISHGSLQTHFQAAQDAVRSHKGSKEPHGIPALQALRAVGNTKRPFDGSIAATDSALTALAHRGDKGRAEIEELRHHLAASRVGVLQLVRDARELAAEVATTASKDTLRKLKCPSEALERLETLAVAQADLESKAELESVFRAQAVFGLGEYWSARAVDDARESYPGEVWALDNDGVHVPSIILQAEALLTAGSEAAGEHKAERMAMRALRLYSHAKLLAKRHHDAAAERRYRFSAALSVRYKRKKLAVHSLSRLAYLMFQRGRKAEALQVIAEAETHGGNALTTFLRTVIARASGELRTSSELLASDKAIASVAGKLPSKALETHREALQSEVDFWRYSSGGDIWRCFQAQDAAHLMICLLCKILFTEPDQSVSESD